MRRALFLDRDGVINADSPDFIKTVDEWIPLPGSLEAIARLSAADYEIVVVTNQSGIARGLYDEGILGAIHARMREAVRAHGGRLAGIYHCAHAPDAGCACRKPAPGLIDRACRELDLEARGAPLVGDRESDLRAARAAGCRPIWVRSGHSASIQTSDPEWLDLDVYPDLARATDALLGDEGEG